MRKISVLILALLVLVIFPTWAVAGEPRAINPKAEEAVIVILNKSSGEVVAVYDLNWNLYHSSEQPRPRTETWEIELLKLDLSPGHWCWIYGRKVWCP